MRLLEFITVLEAAEGGTFVGARLTPETENRVLNWLSSAGVQNVESREKLHVTIIGDKTRHFPWKDKEYPPLKINPSTYSIETLGKDNAMVLRFESPALQKRHEWAKDAYGIEWLHPSYLPHLTLGYDTGVDPKDLPEPDFPLLLAGEFSNSWD